MDSHVSEGGYQEMTGLEPEFDLSDIGDPPQWFIDAYNAGWLFGEGDSDESVG